MRRDDLAGAAGWLGFAGIFLFTAAFNFGFGSLVLVYASESFPARLRASGASVMLTAALVANLVIGLYFFSAPDALGGTVTFALLSGLFVWRLAPETKGRPWRRSGCTGRAAGAGPTSRPAAVCSAA